MVERIYLGNQRLLVVLDFGGKLVVPTWNMDVALGIVRDGIIEPWTTAAVRALLRPGATYVNAGANFGYYMALGAFAVERRGRVIAVEANPYLIPDLMRSIYWSGFPDIVRLHQCAVDDVSGRRVSLNFDPQFIGGGSVQHGEALGLADPEGCFWDVSKVERMKGPGHEVRLSYGLYANVEVETETLDNILHDVGSVDLLHMDIEGSEPAAILGAEMTIRRSPQIAIITEWGPAYATLGDNYRRVARMFELLRDSGLDPYAIETTHFTGVFPHTRPLRTLDDLMASQHGDVVWLRPAAAEAVGVMRT